MIAKTYQHKKYMEHLTYINVDGRDIPIHFKGGVFTPRRINGTFSTRDPMLIDAIDNDLRTGTLWKCVKGDSKKVKKGLSAAPSTASNNPPGGMIAPKSIKTVQAAKEFLIANIDSINPSALTNKRAVLKAAADANIEFPSVS